MKDPYFKKIVSTKKYSCHPLRSKDSRKLEWENTNMMLGTLGYCGLKTGITEAAGPCLSACFHKNGHFLIIVLLSS
jgi:D-alanyl-D-alanine carboxypeptidase